MLRARADVELIARWPVSLVSSYSQARNIDIAVQERNILNMSIGTGIILLSFLNFCLAEQQTSICGFEDYYYEYYYNPHEVENCKDCEEVLCKQTDLTSASSKAANVCYWNDYRDICLPNKGWIICSGF